MVEALTLGRADVSLLAQHMDGSLASADFLLTAARVRLDCILSVDKALRNLGNFAFVVSHLFSAAGRHVSAVAELLCLIEILEELHIKVQGMITPPHLATTLLYDVSRWWSLYLNRYVVAPSSENVGAPGATVSLLLEPIFLDMDGGQYFGPFLPMPLDERYSGIQGGGSSGNNGSGGGREGD